MKKEDLKKLISKDEVFELYVTQHLSMPQICRMYNITLGKFRSLLDLYGIHRHDRKNGEATRVFVIEKDVLYDLYITKNYSKTKIAKMFNTCVATIARNLKFFNIKDKTRIYSKEEIEQVIRFYVEENKSLNQIHQLIDIPQSALRKLLLTNNIKLRDKSTCQLVNTSFKGTFESFDVKTLQTVSKLRQKCKRFMKKFATSIKTKRGYKCEDCGCTENIHAHHIYPSSAILNKITKENEHCSDDELYNIVINHPLVLDENNIKIVCEKCHYTKYHPYTHYHDNQQPSS